MASIRKMPNGRWQAQFRPVPGGKQITKTTRRKIDAQKWLDEQTAALTTGQFVDPKAGRVTFAEYFGQWSARQVWVPGTERAMRLAASSVTFGDVPLSRLLRSHVEQWVKHMETELRGYGREKGLAPGTIRTRFNNVRAVLRAAVRDRVIPADPSEGVRLPRARKGSSLNLPTSEEVRKVLDCSEEHFRVFIALCAFAGLRLGEAAALQAGDIDLEARILRVTRQVQRANGKQVEIRAPKYGSERTVYLADVLVEMLRDYLEKHRPGENRDRWLFEGEQGLPPHQNTVGYWWRKARTAASCESIRLHDLRHFYASGLIAAGCDVVTVQRALGHSSATITLNTYAHLWPSAADRTRSAASGLIGDVLGKLPSASEDGEDDDPPAAQLVPA
ncbi:tyrosine-type recombinase/integrase [Saccharopolyspora spinosa]|uniref:Site-specific recombinase XerD n=1 Tax=Saccharopolyspora spinosa TaxID=60894 RepID=A0A2N3XUP9_SACSN|nr:site-specific integrase [Saccharopolyspora spinosa]PKW14404.1 site-specific recombinase XerD [Saccharopolyspora spinosa]